MSSLKVLNSPLTRIFKVLGYFFALLFIGVSIYSFLILGRTKLEVENIKYIEASEHPFNISKINDVSKLEKRIRKVNWDNIKAKSVYAFNPETGKVYYQRNINERLPIASITKLVTVLTARTVYSDSEILKVSNLLPKMDNQLGIKVGDAISINELFKCSLIASKNDCANAIAYTYGYDNYVAKMNEYASMLGLKDTNFSNPTGYINENNYSTARDLGVISSVFVRDSDLVKITDMNSAIIELNGRRIPVRATNLMLSENRNIKGLKTGFTYASGQCLVLYYDYGNDEKLITIVLNSPDRFKESREIFDNVVREFNP